MASKGSIAVDGVSLTIVASEPDRFSIALIPYTLAVTTLGSLVVGGRVNLETDILAKYVKRHGRGERLEVVLYAYRHRSRQTLVSSCAASRRRASGAHRSSARSS